MYRYVPFDEIEKNKWNGTVHYSSNGNIFGYYWYLKAVYNQWDAIVEDDYVSVLPILPRAHMDQYQLTPQLGPYSVNPLSKARTADMISMMLEHTDNAFYPINLQSFHEPFHTPKDVIIKSQELHLIDSYESIVDGYSSETNQVFDQIKKEEVTFTSSIKPEIIVEQLSLREETKNAYLRIMYNAMHRGIGWSQGIVQKSTGQYLALSFFVLSHNVIHEILCLPTHSSSYKLLLYDISFKNGAGKPTLMVTYHDDEAASALGFDTKSTRLIKINNSLLDPLKLRAGGKL